MAQQANCYGDPGSLQLLHAFSRDLRIWVRHGDDRTLDPGSDNSASARRRSSLMRAGLEIDVESTAARFGAGLFQGEHFGVFQPVICVEARANDFAFGVHHDRAHARIRRRERRALARQVQALAHDMLVWLGGAHENRESTKFLALKGSRSATFSPTPT